MAVSHTPRRNLFSRFLGVDRNGRPFAPRGFREYVEALTTSTTSVSANGGLTSVSSSSGAWTVGAPSPGVVKKFTATSTSTLSRVFTLASGNIETGPSVGGKDRKSVV